MTGRTHVLVGVVSLEALHTLTGFLTPDLLPLLITFAALGALLPDLDAGDSQIKHLSVVGVSPFAPLSDFLNQTFGHRGLLHSLWGWGLVTLIFLPFVALWNVELPFALSLGYASHIAADACTKRGVPLFYPRRKRYHLLPRSLRVTTGSLAEEAVFVGLACLFLLILLHQLPQPV